jgi:predicted amidohydrolase YtcJ
MRRLALLRILIVVFSTTSTAAFASPDVVYVNGKVLTVDDQFSIAGGFAIESGRFAAVGDSAGIQKLADGKTKVVDLGGRTVIPGLIDNHNHFIRGAQHWGTAARLDGIRSRAAALEKLKAHAAGLGASEWLLVLGGWNEEQFADDPRGFTRAELDGITGNRPAFLQAQYSHAFVNTAFLEHIGALNDGEDGEETGQGGDSRLNAIFGPPLPLLVERDESGVPASRLAGGMGMVLQTTATAIPELSPEQLIEGVKQAQRHYNALGLTTAYDPAGALATERAYQAVEAVHDSGDLTLRVFCAVPTQPLDPQSLKGMLSVMRRLPPWLSNLALRMFNDPTDVDDTIGVIRDLPPMFTGDDFYDTLAIGEPLYLPMHDSMDSFSEGVDITEKDRVQVRAVLAEILKRGIPVQPHAVHADTLELYIKAAEELSQEFTLYPNQITFTHAEGVTRDQLRRLQSLGIGLQIRSMQVVRSRDSIAREYTPRALRTPPMRDIQDSGVAWGLGTDGTKAAQIRPMWTLYWAVTGRAINGDQVLDAEQLLSREEALIAHTRGNAPLVFRGHSLGQIRPGFLADFVILDADYLSVDVEEVPKIQPVQTVVGGRVVFDSGALGKP